MSFRALRLLLLFLRARFNLRALPVLKPVKGTRAPDCMVVIPARDEEDVIGQAVRSLPHDTVIVVDDGSSDATAKTAQEAGAGVLPAPSLPRGGTGKANACAAGAQPLTSRWILFADADTWFEPGFLEAAVAASEASGVSFLSVYPKPSPCRFSGTPTRSPYLRALYFAGTNPKSSPAEAFNGPGLCWPGAKTYEFLGGHNAILREAVDDIRLAMLAEQASCEIRDRAGAGTLPNQHVSRRKGHVARLGAPGRPLSYRQSTTRAGELIGRRNRSVVAARAGLADLRPSMDRRRVLRPCAAGLPSVLVWLDAPRHLGSVGNLHRDSVSGPCFSGWSNGPSRHVERAAGLANALRWWVTLHG